MSFHKQETFADVVQKKKILQYVDQPDGRMKRCIKKKKS